MTETNKKYKVVDMDYSAGGVEIGAVVEAVPEHLISANMRYLLDAFGNKTPQVIVYNDKGYQQCVNRFCLKEIE